jgi:uncharacterized protein (TIGR02145 family)
MKTKQIRIVSIVVCCFWFSALQAQTGKTLTDIDGNVYKTVKIGDKVIMTENLRVKRYQNGEPILAAPGNDLWKAQNKDKNGAWCSYNNNAANALKYGNLYNFYAVRDKRNLCPTGWNVPSKENWASITGSMTDEQKRLFSPQLGGFRSVESEYKFLDQEMDLWSSTPDNTYGAYCVEYASGRFKINSYSDYVGLGVRCFTGTDQSSAQSSGTAAHTINSGPDTFKDIDGNVYKFVTIGDKYLMTENLKVKRYQNGDSILSAPGADLWSRQKTDKKGAWCYYNNDGSTVSKYGLLYNFYVANDSRNVCPAGWRVPDKTEWEALSSPLMAKKELLPPDAFRYSSGSGFNNTSSYGSLWSSSVNNSQDAWQINLSSVSKPVLASYTTTGLGIRCVKDAGQTQATATANPAAATPTPGAPEYKKPSPYLFKQDQCSILFPGEPKISITSNATYSKSYIATYVSGSLMIYSFQYAVIQDAVLEKFKNINFMKLLRETVAKNLNASISDVRPFTYKYIYSGNTYKLSMPNGYGLMKEISVMNKIYKIELINASRYPTDEELNDFYYGFQTSH